MLPPGSLRRNIVSCGQWEAFKVWIVWVCGAGDHVEHWQAVDVCKIDLCYSWLPLRYTYAVDLYSYGVMLYMLVSGGETSQRSPATGAR